eukprot:gene11524-biopygen13937
MDPLEKRLRTRPGRARFFMCNREDRARDASAAVPLYDGETQKGPARRSGPQGLRYARPLAAFGCCFGCFSAFLSFFAGRASAGPGILFFARVPYIFLRGEGEPRSGGPPRRRIFGGGTGRFSLGHTGVHPPPLRLADCPLADCPGIRRRPSLCGPSHKAGGRKRAGHTT